MTQEEFKLKFEKEFQGGFTLLDIWNFFELHKQQFIITNDSTTAWPHVTPNELYIHICDIMGASVDDVKSKARQKRLVKVRSIYFYLARTIYDFGLFDIGICANRGHADVAHHVKKYVNYLDSTKPWYCENLDMEVRKVKAQLYERLINC